jgi:hypothetical protein
MRNKILVSTAFMALVNLAAAQDLVVTGVIDGPLSGGLPKAIEICVLNDVTDLSNYGIGSANNGGGSDGEEFTFPAVAAAAGDFIYVASEATGFNSFFGFGRADLLASLALFDDNPSQINEFERGMMAVTPELIQKTATEYLRPTNRTTLVLEAGAAEKEQDNG